MVPGELKDWGIGNTSTKRQRVSLKNEKRLTRWRFVLVLLGHQDVEPKALAPSAQRLEFGTHSVVGTASAT